MCLTSNPRGIRARKVVIVFLVRARPLLRAEEMPVESLTPMHVQHSKHAKDCYPPQQSERVDGKHAEASE